MMVTAIAVADFGGSLPLFAPMHCHCMVPFHAGTAVELLNGLCFCHLGNVDECGYTACDVVGMAFMN